MFKLSMKNENIQRKVGDVMGGKVIDLPEIRLYRKGKSEGYAEGIAQTEEKYKDVVLENERLRKEVEELKAMMAK